MGWLDSPVESNGAQINAFFDGRTVDLELICSLAKNYQNAKKDLDKKRTDDIHNQKARIKHELSAKDKNIKEDLLMYAIEYFYKSNIMPQLKPCPNE